MNFLKREFLFSSILLGPMLLAVCISLATALVALKIVPDDSSHAKIKAAVESHLQSFKKTPLSVFDGHVYLARNEIKKGAMITEKLVDETEFPETEAIPEVSYLEETVFGKTAQREIRSGELLQEADLSMSASPKFTPEVQQSGFDTASVQFLVLVLFPIMLALVSYLIGYVWLIVAAFKKNIFWGVGTVLFAPFSSARFILKNWDSGKRPFKVMTASLAVMSIFFGFCAAGKVRTMEIPNLFTLSSLENKLDKVSPVAYTVK